MCEPPESGKVFTGDNEESGGQIFSLKTIRIFGDFRRQDLGWLFGSTDPKIVSGVVTWLGLVIVALAVRQFTQKHARLFAVREPS